jgi:hypothetical protein
MLRSFPDTSIIKQKEKENIDSFCFVTFYDWKKIFCWHFEGNWRKQQDPDPNPLVSGMDPYKNFMDLILQHWNKPQFWIRIRSD